MTEPHSYGQSYGSTILAPLEGGGAPAATRRLDRRVLVVGVAVAALLAGTAGAWAAGIGPFSSSPSTGPAPAAPAAATAFESLPAAQILAASVAAAKAAGSVHLVVRIVEPGHPTLGYTMDAGTASGLQIISGGSTSAEIRVVSGVVYLKASDAFLRQPVLSMPAATAARMTGRWIRVRTGEPAYSALADGVTFASALGQVTAGLTGTLSKATVETLTGRALVRVCASPTTGPASCVYVDPISHLVDHGTATVAGAGEIVTASLWGERVAVAAPSSAPDLASLHH